MTRVGIITQARMTSTRLPGKVLLGAGGRTMLAHHVSRLRSADAQIIVATTTNATDDAIVAAAESLGVDHFRGSEEDVLSRSAGAAEAFGLDVVVRVTSDCPLIDGDLVRTGIDAFLDLGNADAYVSNTLMRSFPRGFDFEVFSGSALREAAVRATTPAEREHVTPFINQNRTGRVTTVPIVRSPDASRFRVTLDTVEDLELLRRLIEQHDASLMDADRIIDILEHHPELVVMNAHIEQKKLGE